MADFDNTNRGALFKNENKRSERSAEYSGSINVDGKEYFIDAWVKDGKKGKFFSLSVKEKTGRKEAAGGADPLDSDMPF